MNTNFPPLIYVYSCNHDILWIECGLKLNPLAPGRNSSGAMARVLNCSPIVSKFALQFPNYVPFLMPIGYI